MTFRIEAGSDRVTAYQVDCIIPKIEKVLQRYKVTPPEPDFKEIRNLANEVMFPFNQQATFFLWMSK